jgi:arabinogalactan endo-1,4-beta-galactosidase
MEASGVNFFNAGGTQQDCLQILQGVGMNSIRLRVWVNPAGGWNGQTDIVNKAVRAANLGFRIMIDFHYSDSWADPGQQTKPAAWSAHGISQLVTDVSDHTTAVLNALKTAGVTPEWVQVGNETNDGMLWPEGRASTAMANFASLVTSGRNAVKAVFPNAKVIVHVSNGYDNVLFRWMFDGLTANGAQYDVIGMSLYPSAANWATLDGQCLANMNDMVARYSKEVMIAEVGMSVSAVSAAKSFLADIINKTRAVSGGKGLGVFYWEPEAYNNWQGYGLGAFGSNGRPTEALDAFALNAVAQTITFGPLSDKQAGDVPFALSATASSGLPVSFSVISGPATILGNTVTLTGVGLVVIRAGQPGDATYEAAPDVDRSFSVTMTTVAPVITTQPLSQAVPAGNAVTFTVAASGTPAPAFQWQKNGVTISGATGNTFTIASAAPADAGFYTVVATNTVGSVNSSAAVLTVVVAPFGAVVMITVE